MKNNQQMAKEGGVPDAWVRQQSPRPRTKHTLCRNWKATGECRFGDRCSFVHYESDMGQPRQLVPSESVDDHWWPSDWHEGMDMDGLADEVETYENPQADWTDPDAAAPLHPH